MRALCVSWPLLIVFGTSVPLHNDLEPLYLSERPIVDRDLHADGATVSTANGIQRHLLDGQLGGLDPALVVSWPAGQQISRLFASMI